MDSDFIPTIAASGPGFRGDPLAKTVFAGTSDSTRGRCLSLDLQSGAAMVYARRQLSRSCRHPVDITDSRTSDSQSREPTAPADRERARHGLPDAPVSHQRAGVLWRSGLRDYRSHRGGVLRDPDLPRKSVHEDDRLFGGDAPTRAQLPPVVILRWIHPDGRVVHAEHRRVPVYNDAGQMVAIEGIARDVTEFIEGQRRLRESEEQLRQLAARMHDAREAERAQVARELHDELGQTLTALKLDISRMVQVLTPDHLNPAIVDRLAIADWPERHRPRDRETHRHHAASAHARPSRPR